MIRLMKFIWSSFLCWFFVCIFVWIRRSMQELSSVLLIDSQAENPFRTSFTPNEVCGFLFNPATICAHACQKHVMISHVPLCSNLVYYTENYWNLLQVDRRWQLIWSCLMHGLPIFSNVTPVVSFLVILNFSSGFPPYFFLDILYYIFTKFCNCECFL